jgi:hypothetical protein
MIKFFFFLSFLRSGTSQQSSIEDLNRLKKISSEGKSNLMFHEYERLSSIAYDLKLAGIKIKGFYHTSSYTPYWKYVIQEQLYLMDGKRIPRKWSGSNPSNISDASTKHVYQSKVSILDHIESLYVNIAVNTEKDYQMVYDFIKSLRLKHHDKLQFNFNETLSRRTFDGSSPEMKAKYQANKALSEGFHPCSSLYQDLCHDFQFVCQVNRAQLWDWLIIATFKSLLVKLRMCSIFTTKVDAVYGARCVVFDNITCK